MPEMSLADSIVTSLNAQEPWPDNVKLFQPYEVEQILLPDNASCLAVQAFLKMCNLPFEVEMRWNAEFMSPSGRVPFIKCGAFVVSELESIAQFAANKGVTLCSKLSSEERAEMRAYMSLITNVLVNAELYISWLDQETFNAVTRVRNSSVYPWPLGWIQTRTKRSAVLKRLKALHWHDKTLDQVLADVEQCCNSLSQRLGDKDYFFGTPTPLDALVYGHVRALLSAKGPKAALMLKPITRALLRHVVRVSKLTGMALTQQEEYLVSKGCRVSSRKVHDGTKCKRTKISVQNMAENKKHASDVFGFQHFPLKQVVFISNEAKITCEYDGHKQIINDKYRFIIDLLEEIINKADEIVTEDAQKMKCDFEVIVATNDLEIEKKNNVAIDAIKEHSRNVNSTDIDDEIEFVDSITGSNGYPTPVVSSQCILNEVTNLKNDNIICKNIRPTELDALVFGHVFTIITTRLPCRKLADTVRKCSSLVALAKRIDEQYFKRP